MRVTSTIPSLTLSPAQKARSKARGLVTCYYEPLTLGSSRTTEATKGSNGGKSPRALALMTLSETTLAHRPSIKDSLHRSQGRFFVFTLKRFHIPYSGTNLGIRVSSRAGPPPGLTHDVQTLLPHRHLPKHFPSFPLLAPPGLLCSHIFLPIPWWS